MENERKYATVFVTIGTTKFNKLIKVISSAEIINNLKQLGCSRLIIQFGDGDGVDRSSRTFRGIQVRKYSFKENIIEDIKLSDLVISHAGAGTCIEVLRENKHLVVVVNDELMHNHQTELAEKLFMEKYLIFCNVRTLNYTLRTSNFNSLKLYQKGNMSIFIEFLDKLVAK